MLLLSILCLSLIAHSQTDTGKVVITKRVAAAALSDLIKYDDLKVQYGLLAKADSTLLLVVKAKDSSIANRDKLIAVYSGLVKSYEAQQEVSAQQKNSLEQQIKVQKRKKIWSQIIWCIVIVAVILIK